MKGNFPFKFWCHKVLPLVYDDSISYYEFLCKIAKLVNDISEHNEEQDIAIANNAEHIGNVETKVDTLSGDVLSIAKRICAEAFTVGKTYFVGDYCVYYPNATNENEMLMKGELYKSKDTQLAINEFDDSKWDKVSVSSELKLLFNLFDELLNSLAKRYYPNTQYNKNDIVFYDNKIWICKEATSASEFDEEKWGRFDLNILVEMTDDIKHNIANKYVGYSGETITYPKYSVVWYDNKLYRAEETVVVDSASVLPPSENLKWQQKTMSEIFITNNWTIESVANDLANTKLEIASGYVGYSGETITYPKYSVVWYDNKLYRAEETVVVDSASVLPPSENLKWQQKTMSEIFITNNWTIESVANDLSNTKLEIASGYVGYSGTPLFYAKDTIVWYNDRLYKALVDITVDSESVLPPDSNNDWQRTTITENLGGGSGDVDLSNIYEAIGVQIDKVGFEINVPKYTIGYTEYALNGRQLYYANKDTTAGAGYEPNDWTLLSSVGLYGWVKLITDDISRYSEVLTAPINTIIN